MRKAVIDIGTNSVLMLIADIGEYSSYCVVWECARILRLGEGITTSSVINSSALERTVAVLQDYSALCRDMQVEHIGCIDTEVFRRAENNIDVLDHIQKETGFSVSILSGEEEAHLSFISAVRENSSNAGSYIVIDVGGGSTEIIRGLDLSRVDSVSIPQGAVILTEQYINNDPPRLNECTAMRTAIHKSMQQYLTPEPSVFLIGIGGTVTTLAAVYHKMEKFNPETIDKTILTADTVKEILNRLTSLTTHERAGLPDMEAGRADIMVGGTVLLLEIMQLLAVSSVQVSTKGVRFDYLLSEMGKNSKTDV